VRQSVELLHVDRIDHGNACLDDDALVATLVERQIPLTVCPLSNLALQVVKHLPDHPIKIMLDKGLCATMNSDDPSFFGGYVNQNFQDCTEALGLTRAHIVQLARNSLQASFVPDDVRRGYLARLDAYVREFDAQDPALVD
jgi:adenine deaminase